MGQGDVIEFLKANPNDWFTCREISTEINVSYGSVTVSLMRLRGKDEVNYKIPSGEERNQYYYKFKK